MISEIFLQVFLFQKAAVYKCNMAGKPAVITRVVDSMTDNLRPTRAEATDVANAILDGNILLLEEINCPKLFSQWPSIVQFIV